ncbi:hypothetical protein [uncultured Hymenobacter sp.]|uniref:hypothetical protein n=1 Tax=uncultured Hymenobacter sp. TaxID=170016 RepID=UPI0035CB74B3
MPVPPFNLLFYYGLLASCLLLGLWLVLLAGRRPQRRQRGARMLASAIAAAALWLSAYPPSRPVLRARSEAILLTQGYAPDTLRQLLRRLGAATPVWLYEEPEAAPSSARNSPAGTRPLPSLLTLAEQRPALRRLHVLGQGLPAAELPALGALPVVLHPGAAFAGFRTAFWSEKLALSEVLRVEGSVVLPPGGAPAWVGLRAAGAVRDSMRLPPSGGAFALRYQPKAAGLALYELVLRQAGRPLITEPVPVEIRSAPPRPAVLLLAATPSFEFKFLKNHLAEAHYPVALRTIVSRGLAQTDFTNQLARPLDRLTPALLAAYQVIIADVPTLAGLTGAEAQALQTAVQAGRLGLLVLADGAAPLPRAVPARADFVVRPRPAPATAPAARLSWPTAPATARAALPAQLRPAPALRRLVTGGGVGNGTGGAALVAAGRRVGLGAVVVSVVPETFRWALQGQQLVYASFWNRLLTAAVPPAPAAATWRVTPRWPRPHQPLTLRLAGALPAVQPTVGALAGGPTVRLALRQDTRLPEWSTASFWPAAPGWQQVRGPGQGAQHFYVYPAAAWAGPEAEARRLAIAQRAAPGSKIPTPPPGSDVPQPWPAAWFFGLFLLAAGYLWLEEKL